MNRFKLLFALGATAAALAAGGCDSRAPSGQLRTASSGQALGTTMVMRVNLPPAVLPGDPLSLEVSFRNSAGQLLDVTDKVTVGLATKAGGTVIKGTTTVAAVHGVATFTDLVIAQPGQGYQLLLTSPRATAVTSAPFAVTWSTDELEAPGAASNDTASGAEAISPNVPLFGTLWPGDVDTYRFHARAGQLLSVATHATRLELRSWDTSVRLRLIAPDGTTEIARGGSFGGDSPSVDNGFAGVRIPADGDYYLACDGDRRGFFSGRYALLLRLLPLPSGLQLESEPAGATGQNDTPATAQTLSPGVLYGSSDVVAAGAPPFSDYFKIIVAAPQRLHLDLTATRNGSAWGDNPWSPRLELRDAAGTMLWGDEGSAFVDPAVDFIVTVPGTYYVRVASAAASASGTTPYFLTYNLLPYQAAVEAAGNTTAALAMPIGYGSDVAGSFKTAGDHYFTFAGSAGDAVRLWVEDQTQLQGASLTLSPSTGSDAVFLAADGVTALPRASFPARAGQGASNVRQTILPATGSFLVRLRSASVGNFGLRLDRIASSAMETEPNDSAAQGNPIDAGGLISGAIGAAGDRDHFTVHALAGQLVSVSLYAGNGGIATSLTDWGSALLPAVEIRDPQGNLLSAASADRKGEINFAQSALRPESMVEASFRAASEGNYDVAVADADGQGGASFFYALRVWKNQ